MPGASSPAQCTVHNAVQQKNSQQVRIIKPQDGETFIISDDLSPEIQRIELQAIAKGELSWFVDGVFIAKSSDVVSWQLQIGKHEIVCVNAAGQSDSVTITISGKY